MDYSGRKSFAFKRVNRHDVKRRGVNGAVSRNNASFKYTFKCTDGSVRRVYKTFSLGTLGLSPKSDTFSDILQHILSSLQDDGDIDYLIQLGNEECEVGKDISNTRIAAPASTYATLVSLLSTKQSINQQRQFTERPLRRTASNPVTSIFLPICRNSSCYLG